MSHAAARADCGLDATKVVRNLFVFAVIGLALWLSARVGVWSGIVRIPVGGSHIGISLAATGLGSAIGLTFTA